ncbi:MAG: hypothetical protein GY754_22490 [bacterium]|nr:hypothetical protein [bacterium]
MKTKPLRLLLFFFICGLLVWPAEPEVLKSNPIRKNSYASIWVDWNKHAWKSKVFIKINNQVLTLKDNNKARKIRINNNGLDTVYIKIRSLSSLEKSVFSGKYKLKFKEGKEYVIRDNPCSRFEVYAVPMVGENVYLATYRVKMINGANKKRWLERSLSDECIKMQNAQFTKYYENFDVSANCVFSSKYFSVYNRCIEGPEKNYSKSNLLDNAGFIFLHKEKLSIIYNEKKKKIFFKIDQ